MGYYTDYLIKAKGSYAEITEMLNFLNNQRIHSDDLTEEEKEKWDKRDKAFPFPCTFPHGQVKDEEIYHGTKGVLNADGYCLAMVMSFKYIWNFGIVLYIQDYLKRMSSNAKVIIYSLSEGTEKPSIHFVDKNYTYTLLTEDMYGDYLSDVKEGLHDEVELEVEGNKHLFNYFLDLENNKEAVKQQVDGYPNHLRDASPFDWSESNNLIVSAYFAPNPYWLYLASKRSKLIIAHLIDHYGEKLLMSTQPLNPWISDSDKANSWIRGFF